MEIQLVKKINEKNKAKVLEKRERKNLEIEERKKNFKREQLKREIKLGSQNAIQLQNSWREIMMKIKMPNIKENVEIACHTFNRVLDFKDYRQNEFLFFFYLSLKLELLLIFFFILY